MFPSLQILAVAHKYPITAAELFEREWMLIAPFHTEGKNQMLVDVGWMFVQCERGFTGTGWLSSYKLTCVLTTKKLTQAEYAQSDASGW